MVNILLSKVIDTRHQDPSTTVHDHLRRNDPRTDQQVARLRSSSSAEDDNLAESVQPPRSELDVHPNVSIVFAFGHFHRLFETSEVD